jgi:hypothetical protein
MISILSICFTLVFAALSHATPKMGDFASYQLEMSSREHNLSVIIDKEILSFDASQNSYLVRQTMTQEGNPPESLEENTPADQMITDEMIDSILVNCGSTGGSLQSVTVPAGTFNTCAMPIDNESESGTVWIAKVPFGFVQLQTTSKSEGVTTRATLRSFR